MITGTQIREGRELAGWSRHMLAFKSGVRLASLVRAEGADGQPVVSEAHANGLKRALKAAGVEFTNVSEPGVKLGKQQP